MPDAPVFPLVVTDLEDGSEETFNDQNELASTIEWCDTDNPEERLKVVDSQGREVRLKIEKLEITACEFKTAKGQGR